MIETDSENLCKSRQYLVVFTSTKYLLVSRDATAHRRGVVTGCGGPWRHVIGAVRLRVQTRSPLQVRDTENDHRRGVHPLCHQHDVTEVANRYLLLPLFI